MIDACPRVESPVLINGTQYAVVTEVQALALATDTDAAVREAAAENPHLPAAALRPLLADPRSDVRAIAILHREVDDATRRRVHADLVA